MLARESLGNVVFVMTMHEGLGNRSDPNVSKPDEAAHECGSVGGSE